VTASKVSGYDRDPLDFYIEPEWCTEALLALPTFSLIYGVLDPCCGSGNVVRAAWSSMRDACGTDIVDRGQLAKVALLEFGKQTNASIRESFVPQIMHNIAVVSNPPYGGGDMAEAFIRHFVPMRAAQVVAVFVQSRFLHSGKRHKLHAIDHRPSVVAHLSDRPSCPPGDALLAGEIEAKGGSQDYCWLIYDRRGWDVSTRTVWLRRPTQTKKEAA
jgi:hypothetical protein